MRAPEDVNNIIIRSYLPQYLFARKERAIDKYLPPSYLGRLILYNTRLYQTRPQPAPRSEASSERFLPSPPHASHCKDNNWSSKGNKQKR